VLEHYQVPLDSIVHTAQYFGLMAGDPKLDAAMFTTGLMNPTLKNLLLRGDLELVGFADAEGFAASHPWFTATTIPPGFYRGNSPVPAKPVQTVAVMALLVVQELFPVKIPHSVPDTFVFLTPLFFQ